MIWNQWTTDLVLVKEYKCGYAANFWLSEMFFAFQAKRKDKLMSIQRTNMGG